MALATLDDELYDEVKKISEECPVDYPTASHLINQAVKKEIEKFRRKIKGE